MPATDPSVDDLLAILERENLFLTGAAGTGKSWLTSRVIEAYEERERGVVALGSTGVSAVNIGGVTVHSFFVLGISNTFDELREHDRRNKRRLTELKRLLKATELIIIDEISMIGVETLEMIRYRVESLGYEGRMMFVGDFYQLPPVVKGGLRASGLFGEALYAFESGAWAAFVPRVVELREMKRTWDAEFTRILSRIRRGERDDEVVDYLLRLCNNEALLKEDPTWLYGRNREVEAMNRESLARLGGEEYLFFAELEQEKPLHEKRLESWLKLLPVQESLHLKIGAPVLFTVNRWGRYVNGERGILHAVEAEALIVEKEAEFVRVEPHEFVLGEPALDEESGRVEMRPLAMLRQFPLRLAYAVTIHKSQGMSLDRLVCNVDTLFVPSQFYVAISRATDPKGLKIDFNRGDLAHYLERVIRVDDRVRAYYDRVTATEHNA